MSQDFARFMPEVAALLLGEANARLSSKKELRFGTHGSLAVDLKAGTFFDHELKEGGGVLDLIARETGRRANGPAVEWLKEQGFEVEEDDGARPSKGAPPNRKIVATYDYVDEEGNFLFQVVRFEPKDFRQRRKPKASDPPEKIKDDWVWSVKGIRQVPYRLPEFLEALAMEHPVYIVEGEKDVDNLRKIGLNATCNAMGAGKWPPGLEQFFGGAEVVIVPDNDEAGRNHTAIVGAALQSAGAKVRVLDLPGLPEKGDVSDWIAAGGTVETLNHLVETRAVPWSADLRPLHFEAVWFADAETAMVEPEWLIDDMLTRGDLSLVYGESQSGKSFFATHLAMAIARGEEVLGHKVMRPGGVIYVAAEGKKGFKWRLMAYRRHFGLPERADIPFVLLPVEVDMFAEEGDYPNLLLDVEQIAGQMKARGVRLELVVFDTHAAVSPGAKENASEDVTRMLKHYKRVQAVTRAHVMIVHHKNAGGEKPRGHTGLYAAVDNSIEISDEEGARTAHIIKVRDGPAGEKIAFRLQSLDVATRAEDGKAITSCVVAPGDSSERRMVGRAKLSNYEKIALEALREAVATAGETLPASFDLPHGIKAVRVQHWKREFLGRAFSEEPTPGVFRSAVKRVTDSLQAKRVIGRQQPYIWIVREPSA